MRACRLLRLAHVVEPARQKRVLVVDDEEGILEVCAEILTRLPVEVVTEQRPLAALDLLADQGPFDLLVTNLNMPRMSGLKLLERVRQRWPQMPVMIMTGYPAATTAQRCRELGAREYLAKPFLPSDLVERSARLLERPPAG